MPLIWFRDADFIETLDPPEWWHIFVSVTSLDSFQFPWSRTKFTVSEAPETCLSRYLISRNHQVCSMSLIITRITWPIDFWKKAPTKFSRHFYFDRITAVAILYIPIGRYFDTLWHEFHHIVSLVAHTTVASWRWTAWLWMNWMAWLSSYLSEAAEFLAKS